MGDYMTADEIRAESVEKMGETLGNIRYELNNQVVLLHIIWKTYRELFAASLETISLLDAAAPAFFYDLDASCGKTFFSTYAGLPIRRNQGRTSLILQFNGCHL